MQRYNYSNYYVHFTLLMNIDFTLGCTELVQTVDLQEMHNNKKNLLRKYALIITMANQMSDILWY